MSVVFRRGAAQRTLHLTWMAFFLSFVVWFNFAPFAGDIGKQFGLDKGQLVTLGLCNLALTVPARLIIGGVLDRFGPRRTFSAILIFAIVPCMLFATAQSFSMLLISRLLVSVVGAGFVVGIRMVAEWFPPTEVGTAEGVYGGWGNFGAAAASLGLPVIAGIAGGEDGWRWAAALTGVAAAAYGFAYSRLVSDTPAGVPYVRAKSAVALEVTNRRAVFGLMTMFIPAAVALAVIAWRVKRVGVIGTGAMIAGFGLAALFLLYQVTAVRRVNQRALAGDYPEDEQYPFISVVVLSLAYFCTFGSELAA
ncbi:MAG: MFS transporter, partial [Actinobacteria bacterium]|nr:MFS transporter [Actinomycetota bacterium]